MAEAEDFLDVAEDIFRYQSNNRGVVSTLVQAPGVKYLGHRHKHRGLHVLIVLSLFLFTSVDLYTNRSHVVSKLLQTPRALTAITLEVPSVDHALCGVILRKNSPTISNLVQGVGCHHPKLRMSLCFASGKAPKSN